MSPIGAGVGGIEKHFGAVLGHIGRYRPEGCIEVVGVPKKRDYQPEAIRAATECEERGGVQCSVGAFDMLYHAYSARALGGRNR
jgi:hypothetical protein